MDGLKGGAVAREDAVLKLGRPKMECGMDGWFVHVGEEALEVFFVG